jgi:hypothetical protein
VGNVLVFEIGSFFEGLVKQLAGGIRHGRLRAAAGNFGELLDFLVHVGQHSLRADADLVEHRRNDAFFVFKQRGEQVRRHELGIAVLGGKIIGALDCFLRLDGEFVKTDRHGDSIV